MQQLSALSPQPSAQPLPRFVADYGRAAYEAFCQEARAFAPPAGFPRWTSEKFPEALKQAWTAAALAARALN